MKDRQNMYGLFNRLDAVNNPIGREENFTERGLMEFRDHPADLWKRLEIFHGASNISQPAFGRGRTPQNQVIGNLP